MEYIKLTWADIEEQCRALAREIKEQAVPFDVIIGISRGGWVPARLLSDLLDNDEIDTVRVDIADTGGSLAATVEHIKGKGVKSIFVVTLLKKPISKFTPDLFVRETPDWVIFPWEVSETKRNLEAKSDSPDDLQKELEKAGLLL
jgi:hypoxanthine phosphoribosyltransferase